jgi:hypothetical protein
MVLYHLQNPDAPKFLPMCMACLKEINGLYKYACTKCEEEYCLCSVRPVKLMMSVMAVRPVVLMMMMMMMTMTMTMMMMVDIGRWCRNGSSALGWRARSTRTRIRL